MVTYYNIIWQHYMVTSDGNIMWQHYMTLDGNIVW